MIVLFAKRGGFKAVTVPGPIRTLWCGDPAGSGFRRSLEELGALVTAMSAAEAINADPVAFDLIVFDGTSASEDASRTCRHFRALLEDGFVPILYLVGPPDSEANGWSAGADVCLSAGVSAEIFRSQVQALCRVKRLYDRLRQRSLDACRTNEHLEAMHARLHHELELAGRIQRSLLPRTLPEVAPARFAVYYRPCDRIGGDFYDVFRLDEDHIGFYVADAMGHGFPASLLTMFLKKGIRAKEITNNSYRLVPPGEVLQMLNRDLREQGVADAPFITMVYALLDVRGGVLQFARAGHPHPIWVPARGAIQPLKVHGSLLGVFETRFAPFRQQLAPGDKVLFYTDGAEGGSLNGLPAGLPSLLACAEANRALGVEAFVDALVRDLVGQPRQADDVTLLALEISQH